LRTDPTSAYSGSDADPPSGGRGGGRDGEPPRKVSFSGTSITVVSVLAAAGGLAPFIQGYAKTPLELILFTVLALAIGTAVLVTPFVIRAHGHRRVQARLVVVVISGALAVAVSLALGAGVAILLRPGSAPTRVSIAVGSEDLPLFNDGELRDDLKAHGIQVTATPMGSLTMANEIKDRNYDLALPSSEPTTRAVHKKVDPTNGPANPDHPLFTTPLVVMTWKSVLEGLKESGVASQQSDGLWQFHVGRYLDVVHQGLTWDQLPGNTYSNPQRVLLRTTDPAQSNSGLMFLGAASYVVNGNSVMTEQQVAATAAQLKPMYDALGELPTTTKDLFDEYLSDGSGGLPLILTYESLYVAQRLADNLPADAVMMYLDPVVTSAHTLVQLDTAAGRQAFQVMITDQNVVRIAQLRYGFRPLTNSTFVADMRARGIAVDTNLPAITVPELDPLLELANDLHN
jgi:hypothetical protein